MMRRRVLLALLLVFATPAVFGAEIRLEAVETPSQYDTADRAFTLIRFLDVLAVAPEQLGQMANALRPLPKVRENAREAENRILSESHDALLAKWRLLTTEQAIPADVDKAANDALERIASQQAGVAQAEQKAYEAALATLQPWQLVLIVFEQRSAASDIAQQAQMVAERMRGDRLQGMVAGLLRPTFERVWSLRNPQLIRSQSGAAADEIVSSLIRQRMLPETAYDPAVMQVLDFFNQMRALGYDGFQAEMNRGRIFGQFMQALGISPNQLPDETIPESELRAALLDLAGIELLTGRAKAIQDALAEARRAR